MEQNLYKIHNNELHIYIPIKNAGKFRWKNRETADDYGEGFSTNEIPYSEKSYVEWQIGYDVAITDVASKPTSLTELKFMGANGKQKHPYELSEILFGMLEAKIISSEDIRKLINDIHQSKMSLQEEYSIKTEKIGECVIDGIKFDQQRISLPTFVYKEIEGGPVIEVSIQKQQYATGVQPMLYMSIPIFCLKDGKQYIGKTAKDFASNPYGTFVINEKNKDYILNTFRLFGICSQKHKHDVNEILKLIQNYSEEYYKKNK